MKLYIFLLCCSIGLAQATNSYAQKATVSLNMQNQTVQSVLDEIENQSEFSFFFNTRHVDLNRRVSVNTKNSNVFKVLDNVFAGTNVRYSVVDKKIILSTESVSVPDVQQQNKKTVSGIVKDENGEPIIGANVVEKGTTNGTVTDMDGKYTLAVTLGGSLQISYIGFNEQVIKVGKESLINITLHEDTQSLDEVVVVGYGTVKKGNLTNAVTSVKADVLENRPVSSVADALQGQVPGLSIVQSGRPGEASSMQLRGATSLNSGGSPLLLVDGIPTDTENFNYLNVEDIESVSVLKDAASAAVYGSRAANGVILITTKRGKAGKPVFRYNGYVGVNTPTEMPKMVSSEKYARMRNEAMYNLKPEAGKNQYYSEEQIRKFADGSDPNHYGNTDWVDLMFENSITTRHSISATGGAENVKYFLSAGLDYQTGVLPESQHKVYNVRSNIDAQLSKKFNLSFDIRYILRQRDEVENMDGIIIDVYKMNPTDIAYNSDGSYAMNSKSIVNPMADLHQRGHNLNDIHDAAGTFKITYDIWDALKFQGIASVNFKFDKSTTFSRQVGYTDFDSQEVTYMGQNALNEGRSFNQYYNLQALLTYQKKFGEHNLDILAGYQQENEKWDNIGAYRDGFPTDILHVLNAGSKENWSNSGYATHWAIASFIGSLNYDYASKYLLSLKMRSDGSSRLASGNRWSTFPSVSAAWRISSESFMEKTQIFLNDLKIRASWGLTGATTGVGLYPSYSTIGFGNAALGNQYILSAYLSGLGNTDLGWEKTSMLDFGFDARLLDNRLGVTFDYYLKNTKDILIGLPVPLEYGFGKPNVNIGELQNNGWEVELSWNDKIGEFRYGIQANLSNNKNEVKDLGGTSPWKDGYTAEGLAMNSYYGYEALGLFQTEEEVANSPVYSRRYAKPGDVKYKDQNNDGVIDADDRVVLGDRDPHYLFGVTLNGAWKGFDFSVFLQGVGKRNYILDGPSIRPLSDQGKGPAFEHQLDYWTEDNRDAKYPRLLEATSSLGFNHMTSDFWMINAGYLRLKNLQVGYNFSNDLLKNTGFSNIRLYFSANNLFTISNFTPGYDPETLNAFTYPLSRTYSFGLNLQF